MSENMNVNSLGQNTATIEPFTGTAGTGTVGTGAVGTGGTGTTYTVASIAIGVITIFALAGVIVLVYYHTKYGTDFMAAITLDWTRFHAWLNNSSNSSNVVSHDDHNGIPSPHSESQLSSNSPPNSLNTSHTHIGSHASHLNLSATANAKAIASGLADEMFSGGSSGSFGEKERQFGEDGSVTPSNGRNKTGWCYIGEDHNIRSCAEVGPNDVCASNDVFPSEAHCVNPTLR